MTTSKNSRSTAESRKHAAPQQKSAPKDEASVSVKTRASEGATAKKPAAKKPAAKKPGVTAKKPATKKSSATAKKPATKKSSATAKKPATKKPSATAKKPATKKPATKQAAAEKPSDAKPRAAEQTPAKTTAPPKVESSLPQYRRTGAAATARMPGKDAPMVAASAVLKPSHHDIAREAYLIWAESGFPTGQDVNHWLQAEARLMQAS